LLLTAPSVAILGPRQVGKTTLALALADQRPSLYLDLQSEADQIKLADPGYYLRQHADKLIVLDEIHRAPGIFSALRGIIDENRRAGRRTGQFLILGSASLDLLRQSGESLAGRIAFAEMFPLDLLEVGQGRHPRIRPAHPRRAFAPVLDHAGAFARRVDECVATGPQS